MVRGFPLFPQNTQKGWGTAVLGDTGSGSLGCSCERVCMALEVFLRLLCFCMNLVKGRDMVVPLEQRGRGATALDGTRVELPDGIDHGMVVGVENVLLIPRVSYDMHLRDAVRGHCIDIFHGIELVVHRGYINVVQDRKS